jgi:phage baseplate assembly protein W
MAVITPLTKKKTVYADITKDLTSVEHCGKDLVRVTNENAVKESIRNLFLINRGERLMQPDLGSTLTGLLFENAGPAELSLAKSRAEELIEQYEPRANVLDIEVTSDVDTHYAKVTVTFEITTRAEPIVLDVLLRRIR